MLYVLYKKRHSDCIARRYRKNDDVKAQTDTTLKGVTAREDTPNMSENTPTIPPTHNAEQTNNLDTVADNDTQLIDNTGDETPEVQSNRRRIKIIASVAAGALVIACGVTGGMLYASHLEETQRQESLAACEKELKSFTAALKDLDKAKADVAETVKITAEQVADGATVEALAKAVKAQAPKTAACPADGDTETIDANTAKLVKHTKTVTRASRPSPTVPPRCPSRRRPRRSPTRRRR